MESTEKKLMSKTLNVRLTSTFTGIVNSTLFVLSPTRGYLTGSKELPKLRTRSLGIHVLT